MRIRVLCALIGLCAGTIALAGTPASAPSDPVTDKSQAITVAAQQLEQANTYRKKGNKNLAEQLFSSAELILGPEALADIAPLFREGAPPRVTTPLSQAPKDSQPQPASVGNSEEEEPPAPAPKRGSLTGSLTTGDKPLVGRGVVTLEPASGKLRAHSPKDRTMEQRNREFAPKVLVVRVGSTVHFPNFDTVYHNVFSRSDPNAFDLGIYKNGQSRDLKIEKEGVVHLGCNLHANMSAYIVATNAPHYSISDEHGAFKFKSLAPGKYKLKAYSDKSTKPTTRDVTIEAGDNALKVALEDMNVPSVDKFGAPRGK